MRTWIAALAAAVLLSSPVFAAAAKSLVNEEIVIPAKSAQMRQFTLAQRSLVHLSVIGKDNAEKGLRVFVLGGAGQWEKFRSGQPVVEVEALVGIDVKSFSPEAELEPGQYTLIVQNSNNLMSALTAEVRLTVAPSETANASPAAAPGPAAPAVVAPALSAPPAATPPAVVVALAAPPPPATAVSDAAGAAQPPADASQGLCKEGETTLLVCDIAKTASKPAKIASLCGSSIGPSSGTMVYRFGQPGRVEMEYPGVPAHPSKAFQYAPWGGNQGMGSAGLSFVRTNYGYSFNWTKTNGVEAPVTLNVSPPRTAKAKPITLVCGAASSTSYDFSKLFPSSPQ